MLCNTLHIHVTVSEMRWETHELGWLHKNIFILLITILVIKPKFLLWRCLLKQTVPPKCIPLFQYPLTLVDPDFQTFSFRTTHTLLHYKFTPLIHLFMQNWVFCAQLTNKLSDLLLQWCCRTEPQTVFCFY